MRELNFAEEGFVKSGTKSVSEANPTIQLTSSYNGFKLNNKAMDLLGVKVGDRVGMFDMLPSSGNTPNDERYFICAAGFNDKDGIEQGSKIGKDRAFTYGQIWGAMVNDEDTVKSISFEDLVARDLCDYTENGSKCAKRVVTADLVQYGDGPVSVMGGLAERNVYRLVNLRFSEHNIKTMNATSVDENDIPTVENEQEPED